MKYAISLAAFLIASPAFAQDDIQPLSAGVVPQSGWSPFPAVAVTPEDLKAQQDINRAHRLRLREQLIAAGGCNGDDIPVEIASYCNRDAFGYPMGSDGGSD